MPVEKIASYAVRDCTNGVWNRGVKREVGAFKLEWDSEEGGGRQQSVFVAPADCSGNLIIQLLACQTAC
jgi:hypothetical protein